MRGVEGAEDSFELAQRVQKAHARVLWGVSWSPDDNLLATGARDEAVKLWAAVGQAQGEGGGPVVGERAALTLPLFGSPVTSLAFAPAPVCSSTSNVRYARWSLGAHIHTVCVHAHTHAHAHRLTHAHAHARSACTYMLAVGLEDGGLQLWRVTRDGSSGALSAACAWRADAFCCHAGAVRSVCWRACGDQGDNGGEGEGGAQAGGGGAAAGRGGSYELATCGGDHSVRVFGVAL